MRDFQGEQNPGKIFASGLALTKIPHPPIWTRRSSISVVVLRQQLVPSYFVREFDSHYGLGIANRCEMAGRIFGETLSPRRVRHALPQRETEPASFYQIRFLFSLTILAKRLYAVNSYKP